MLNVSFAPSSLPDSGTLVLLIREEASPTGLWQAADQATDGAISRALQAAEFTGKASQSCTILAPGAGLQRVQVVGLGKSAPTPASVQKAAGRAIAALSREADIALAADGLATELVTAAALGATLRAYRFDQYRTTRKPDETPRLNALRVLADAPQEAHAHWSTQIQPVAKGVFLTRDLVSEPPNVLTPVEMARRCEALRDLGVEVEVLDTARMTELGFGALLAVAQGSVQEPHAVVMRWRGAPSDAPLAFIGKGVTFDSGGISIKPAAGMEDMKWDMAGAGAVIGLMAAVAGRKAKADVLGVVGLVENMPSGAAQRPGDVVTTCSGQTVEIINTDAEGRLVLADLVWWTQKTYAPRFMIDLATLTGAMVVSLGHEHAGLFSDSDELADRLLKAGLDTDEALWRMPLGEAYDKQIDSDIADMKNTGPRPGGAISAAHFIKRFTNNVPWAHLDIAGTAWRAKDAPCTPKGATAYGVRLLDRFVADNYETTQTSA